MNDSQNNGEKQIEDLCFSLMTKDYESAIEQLKSGVSPLSVGPAYMGYLYPISICLINDDFYSLLAVLTSIVINGLTEQFFCLNINKIEIDKLTRLKYMLADAGYSAHYPGFRGKVYDLIERKIELYIVEHFIDDDSDSDTDSDSDD